MDVRKMRNDLLGKRLVAALESRNMEAYYVETKEEAVTNLSEKYDIATLLCRKCANEKIFLCREDEAGVWKLLLGITDGIIFSISNSKNAGIIRKAMI